MKRSELRFGIFRIPTAVALALSTGLLTLLPAGGITAQILLDHGSTICAPLGLELQHEIPPLDSMLAALGYDTLIAAEPSDTLTGKLEAGTRWTTGSRHVVLDELIVALRDTLTIEPGVVVELGPMASLTIEGTLLARGTPDRPIVFRRSDPSSPWGRVQFLGATAAVYDDDGNYLEGGILEYAALEGGGAASGAFREGMLLCSGSSPYLHALLLRGGRAANGGGMALVSGSNPLVEDCRIVDNVATGNGGGVYISLNAQAVLRNSVLFGNSAGRDGGGVYISFSPAKVERCVLESNHAGRDGGAVALGGSQPVLIDNVFRYNTADNEGDLVILRAGVEPVITGNSFLVSEDRTAVVTQAGSAAGAIIEAENNWWGTVQDFLLDRLRLDRAVDPQRPMVNLDPVLRGPPDSAPLRADSAAEFQVYEDAEFTRLLPTDYFGFESPLYFRLVGQGAHPEVQDWALIDLMSGSGEMLRVTLNETTPNSGDFRGSASLTDNTDVDDHTLGAPVGDEVTMIPYGFDELAISKPVRLQQPFAREPYLMGIDDLTHLIDDAPTLMWTYFEPRLRPQRRLRFEVLDEEGGVFWSSGEVDSTAPRYTYFGPPFTPGRSFTLRLRVDNAIAWSDPTDLVFHRNSVPPAPEVLRPEPSVVLQTQTPLIELGIDPDREGDSLWVKTQIVTEENPAHTVQVSEWIPVDSSMAVWTPSEPLPDNTIYLLRAEGTDSLEYTGLSPWRRFTVNLFNDTPGPFAIEWPQSHDELLPEDVIRWSEPADPDPEDTLTYTVTLAMPGIGAPAAGGVEPEEGAAAPGEETAGMETPADTTVAEPAAETGAAAPTDTGSAADPPPDTTLAPEPDTVRTAEPATPAPPPMIAGLARGETRQRSFTVQDLEGIGSLVDDALVFLTVQVRDLAGATTIAADSARPVFYNALNDTPTVPVGFSLSDSQRVFEVPAHLAWRPSTDEDHSDPSNSLRYEIELKREDGTPIALLSTEPGTTEMSLDPVEDNSRAVWRVRSLDDQMTPSAWSPPGILEVNVKDEPPNGFALLQPENDARPYRLGPSRFTWRTAPDPDPLNTVMYTLFVATSPDFAAGSVTIEQDLSDTTFTYAPDLEHLVDYYWRVRATDNTGLSTWSDTYGFRIVSTPSVPQWAETLTPEVTPETVLRWEAASDPDPEDVLVYRVEIAASDRFPESDIAVADPVRGTEIMLADARGLQGVLTDDGPLYVRLKARDDQGFEGGWSTVQHAQINFANDPPETPQPLVPKEQRLVDLRPTFQWQAASDEDLSDPPGSLRYIVQIALASAPENPVEHGIDTVLAVTEWRPGKALPDNSELVWRLRTLDDDGAASPWSPSIPFSIDHKPESPGSFNLLSPAKGDTVLPGEPVRFEWEQAIDHDLDSSVHYRLEVDGKVYGPVDGTVYTLEEGLPAAEKAGSTRKVRWKVIAEDNTGLTRSSRSSTIVVAAQ